MDIADAFAGDVSPETFFLERLPNLHEDRLELFGRYSETTLRFCFRMTDTGRTYCLELTPDSARAIEGEFIEFPTVTLEGKEANWPVVRDHARRLFEKGKDALMNRPPPRKIGRDFVDDFERFDGIVDVAIDFPERDDPVEMRLILNDYDPVADARCLEIGLSIDVLDGVLDGRVDADEARNAMSLSGDVGLAFDLGGMMLDHFPEID